MAEEKKDAKPADKKDEKKDKPKSKGSSSGPFTWFLGMIIILFVLWIITGGPKRNEESRYNQFIQPDGSTYHDSAFGQPGSVTNTLPFLK